MSLKNLYDLPKGWVWTSLEEATKKITDGSHYTPKYFPDGYPFITISDVNEGQIDFSNAKRISEDDYDKLKGNCNPHDGDVLFSKDGTVGKVIKVDYEKKFIILSSLAIIRPYTFFTSSDYLKYLLKSDITLNQATKLKTGTAIRRIILRNLKTVMIPIPPLEEQIRITNKIDELFTKLDAGIQELKLTIEKLKIYRQSVLKTAFQGKLTEKWRETHVDTIETASDLLDKIKKEKNRISKRKYNKFEVSSSKITKLPDTWTWTTLSQIALIVSGKTPKGIISSENNTKFPFFKISDMNTKGNEKFMFKSNINLSRKDLERYKLNLQKEGTVIFPKRGGAIATNKKRVLIRPSIYDLNIMGVFPIIMLSEYFYHWISTIDLMSLADGSNVPQINHGDIEPLIMPLAPLEEQREIIRIMDENISVIDEIEIMINQNLVKSNNLRQSILKKAFEGRLVPQGPKDQRAEKLLDL